MKYKTFKKFQLLIWILFAIYCLTIAVFVVCNALDYFKATRIGTGEVFVAPNNIFFNSIPVCFFILLLLLKYVNWLEHYQYSNGYYLWLSYSDCKKFSMISKKVWMGNKYYLYKDFVILFSLPDWLKFRFDTFIDNWRANINRTDKVSLQDKKNLIVFLEDMQGEIDKVKEQAAKEFETGKEIFEKVLDKF